MLNYSSDERLALLLSVLGDRVAESAFQGLNPKRADLLRRLVEEYRIDPPHPEEIEYVVGDFFKYFNFAVQTLAPQINAANSSQTPPAEESREPVRFPPIKRTGDPLADLAKLDPYQVKAALADDHPKTIALVLQKLSTRRAALILEQFSAEIRLAALEYLTEEITVPPRLVDQVLQTIADKACSILVRPVEVDQAEVLSEMLRALPKSIRVEMMNQLTKSNAELADRVKSKLYLFTDILRIEDRDVQKLLAQIETDYLIIALQQSEQDLIDKLLNNLSKRARESIQEEMEYKKGVAIEEIESARQSIVQVIAQLDESGEIKL